MAPGCREVSSSGVGYRLPDGGSSTALDWDGGCDTGTAPSWEAGSMAARLQAANLELAGPKSRGLKKLGVWRLGRRELFGSRLGRREVST